MGLFFYFLKHKSSSGVGICARSIFGMYKNLQGHRNSAASQPASQPAKQPALRKATTQLNSLHPSGSASPQFSPIGVALFSPHNSLSAFGPDAISLARPFEVVNWELILRLNGA